MKNTTVETIAWILIYSGLLLLCLGLFTMGENSAMGWALVVFGGGEAAIGAVLVWWRSRLKG